MCAEDFSRFDSLKLFMHQIYEYRKGVRQLVLCTMSSECAAIMRQRLSEQQIAYLENPFRLTNSTFTLATKYALTWCAPSLANPCMPSPQPRTLCLAPCWVTTLPPNASAFANAANALEHKYKQISSQKI